MGQKIRNYKINASSKFYQTQKSKASQGGYRR